MQVAVGESGDYYRLLSKNVSTLESCCIGKKKLKIVISAFVTAEAWCFTDKMAAGCTKLCQITCSGYIMCITVHEGQR